MESFLSNTKGFGPLLSSSSSSSYSSPMGLTPFSYGNRGYYGDNMLMGGIYSSITWIAQNPVLVVTTLFEIPIAALVIHGFVEKNEKLGFTGILLFVLILILAYIYHYDIGERQQYVLLIILTVVSFVLVIYFALQIKPKVYNHMYINFQANKNTPKIPLSFYGMHGDRDSQLIMMKGNTIAYAEKESMPIDLGPEATYSFWLKVCPDNFNKNNTKWRTIWYRGEDSGNKGDSVYKFKTPGVYLAPNTNKIIISVACENGPDEGNAITVDDIPLNEWFCVTFTLEGRSLDCYINGLLEHSISLTGHPLMMNSNVIKGRNGFNGLMCFYRYSSASLLPDQIKNLYEREKATLEDSKYNLETCPAES